MAHYLIKATPECPDKLKDIIEEVHKDENGNILSPVYYSSPGYALEIAVDRLINNCDMFWLPYEFKHINENFESKYEHHQTYKELISINLEFIECGAEGYNAYDYIDRIMVKGTLNHLSGLSKLEKLLVLCKFRPEFQTWFVIQEIKL